jgi:hypothetical protein
MLNYFLFVSVDKLIITCPRPSLAYNKDFDWLLLFVALRYWIVIIVIGGF